MYKRKVEVEENTQLSFWRKIIWSSDKFDKFALEKFLTVLLKAGSSEENPSEQLFSQTSMFHMFTALDGVLLEEGYVVFVSGL